MLALPFYLNHSLHRQFSVHGCLAGTWAIAPTLSATAQPGVQHHANLSTDIFQARKVQIIETRLLLWWNRTSLPSDGQYREDVTAFIRKVLATVCLGTMPTCVVLSLQSFNVHAFLS